MIAKTITAEQAKQADELGYFLVKVEPQPLDSNDWDKAFFKNAHIEFVNFDRRSTMTIGVKCPFNLNDEVYCDDEQEEWVPKGEYNSCVLSRDILGSTVIAFREGVTITGKELLGKHLQPASTMPASLASKKWTVIGIEVVRVGICRRCSGPAIPFQFQNPVIKEDKTWGWKCLNDSNHDWMGRKPKEKWHRKIIMQDNI